MLLPKQIHLSLLKNKDDIHRVVAMEAASYPTNEAASEASIRFRQKNAGSFFYVAYKCSTDKTVIGFINGTLTSKDTLDHDSMSHHDAQGSLLCIHSVVVDQIFRRQGIATEMLKQYVKSIATSFPQIKRIMLISKAHLVTFYEKCGFSITRTSPIVHGQDPWLELELIL
ncbi:phenazine biosynthesis protein family [Plasmopara halstedii]|uniref:Phenazine biosynthesis protein family n=1 Tax=Plasmopara halstedii TaxID=4781 RepID=A0A0N7L5X5_PLAHL|nr:phenazine biosynthesis protein family [Plasmopara halstedii]CEG42691.1 phenazine biosynthesis protein family [Plasmopara halstedii]|eukprot:XP_024579060.1 phenazine biosynthesis protein family [Plasmopara halstedii]